jgi:hypothetical protein
MLAAASSARGRCRAGGGASLTTATGGVAAVGLTERPVYRLLPGDSRVTRRKGTGSGFQPAMVRAHARACALSATPGNSRRSSMAAVNSPPWSKAVRMAVASASETTNISGAWERGRGRTSGVQMTTADACWRVALAGAPTSGLAGVMPLEVNRAPVLTVWAAVVAERLGHPADTALTLGRAVAGSAARVKAGNRCRQARSAVHRIRAAKSAAKASSSEPVGCQRLPFLQTAHQMPLEGEHKAIAPHLGQRIGMLLMVVIGMLLMVVLV